MTILVTGFGPFEDVDENASGRVAEKMNTFTIGAHKVVAEVLPTAFGAARRRVAELVTEHRPVAALGLGVSRDAWPRIERRASSFVVSTRADVTGEVWTGRRLGEADRETAGDVDAWVRAARSIEAEARASNDCGGYVCNAVYHALLEAMPRASPTGFMHIPRAVDVDSVLRMTRLVEAVVAAMVLL